MCLQQNILYKYLYLYSYLYSYLHLYLYLYLYSYSNTDMRLQQLGAEQVCHPEHKSQLTIPQADHLRKDKPIKLAKSSVEHLVKVHLSHILNWPNLKINYFICFIIIVIIS